MMRNKFIPFSVGCMVAVALAFSANVSWAQLVINAPPTVVGDFFELDSGVTLNVFSGGEVGRGLIANPDSELNISGGNVGRYGQMTGGALNISGGNLERDFEVFDSVVNISGGTVGQFFYVRDSSEVNITGGFIDFRFEAFDSTVNISSGHVGSLFMAHSSSVVDVTGGKIDSLEAFPGSVVNITNGTVGAGFSLYRSLEAHAAAEVNITGGTIGSSFAALSGSDVELVGGEFHLNGVAYYGGDITIGPEDIFTGTLADGSSFIFTPKSGDVLEEVKLTQATLPTLDLTPMIVNSPVTSGASGLRAGQTLTVQAGGVLRDNFAVVDATLNIEGGTVGGGVEVSSGVVSITGGDVGPRFRAINSVVNMSGGMLGERSVVQSGSVMNISGGIIGTKFYATPGSEVNISGGAFGFDIRAQLGSDVELIGNDYKLNGVEFTGDDITLNYGDVFTGALADGSTFIFSPDAEALGDVIAGVKLTRVALPAIDLTPQFINTPVSDGPSGLRPGQTMTVQSGGALRDSFAVLDAELNIEGGNVGSGLEVHGSTVNISGGEVGSWFQAFDSEVNIFNGEIGIQLTAHAGSTINVMGGMVESIRAYSPSNHNISINISGGEIVGSVNTFSGIDANISGGTIGRFSLSSASVAIITGGRLGSFGASDGTTATVSGGVYGSYGNGFGFQAASGSDVELIGGEFRLNGADYDDDTITLQFNDVFTGTFADGSPFVFNLSAQDSLNAVTLTHSALPKLDLTPIIVDAPIEDGPTGLRAGQTLTLRDGGSLLDNFAVVESRLNIEGGFAGNGVEVAGGTVNISGGSFGRVFRAFDGSEINVSGGTLGEVFKVFAGGEVNIFGSQFVLDGAPIHSLEYNEMLLITRRNVVLSGVLVDGSPFSLHLYNGPDSTYSPVSNHFDRSATLTITLIPEPGSIALLAIGFAVVAYAFAPCRQLHGRKDLSRRA